MDDIPKYIEGRYGRAMWRLEREPDEPDGIVRWRSLVLLDGELHSMVVMSGPCRRTLLRTTVRYAYLGGEAGATPRTLVRDILPTLDTRCTCGSCALEAEEAACP